MFKNKKTLSKNLKFFYIVGKLSEASIDLIIILIRG